MSAQSASLEERGHPQSGESDERGPLRTPTSENWVEDGILFSRNVGVEVIDLEEARLITEAFARLAPGGRPLLVDLASPKGQTRGAREYFAKDPIHTQYYTAVALLVSNPISRVLANFFLGMNKPLRPTRLFTDKAEAIEWLQQFRREK